jgi:glycine/D-amino acid oxidase-like deaminating enzyme
MLNGQRPLLSGEEPPLSSSFWTATAGSGLSAPRLSGEVHCDVVVIGGGFNGCTSALRLAENGADAVLLEASEIGAGATGRNAGMVNPGQFLGPKEIENALGPEYGPRFLSSLGGAPELVRSLIQRLNIDCALDARPIIRAAHNRKQGQLLAGQVAAWQAIGAQVETVERDALAAMTGTDVYHSALLDYRGFTIQPLAYIRGLARAARNAGARLFESSPVMHLQRDGERWRVQCAGGSVTAKRVIISTNALTARLLPQMQQEIVPVGAFGYASEPLEPAIRARILPSGHSLYDTHKIPLFLRYDPQGRLMVGCLGFLPREVGDASDWAARILKRLYPGLSPLRWQYRWSGTLGLTPDNLPHLVQPAPGLLATVGCNGRGIAPNTYFGHLLADLALDRPVESPLPLRAPRAYPYRELKLEGYDLGMRLYRNTLLFHFN